MKHLLLVLLGLSLVGVASAAELLTVDGPTYQGIAPGGRPPVTFTQNVNTTLIEPVQVACGVAGTYTTQNWYLRRFYLTADHGIAAPLTVTSVDFGVEQLAMADGSNPPPYDLNVNIYRIASAASFTFGNMGAPIGSAVVTISGGDVGTIVTATIVGAGLVDPATHDLVVAIDAPDGSLIGAGLQFRPGANAQGALWDAYLAAADCGVTEPIAVSDIGFPDSQTIFVVNGTTDTPPPIPAENTSWGQVKALFR
jgi:hypothetical protein